MHRARDAPEADPSATPTPSASASLLSAGVGPPTLASPDAAAAFDQLDRTGAKPLPCDFATKQTAQAALAGSR